MIKILTLKIFVRLVYLNDDICDRAYIVDVVDGIVALNHAPSLAISVPAFDYTHRPTIDRETLQS
jgi:hypothetical protein